MGIGAASDLPEPPERARPGRTDAPRHRRTEGLLGGLQSSGRRSEGSGQPGAGRRARVGGAAGQPRSPERGGVESPPGSPAHPVRSRRIGHFGAAPRPVRPGSDRMGSDGIGSPGSEEESTPGRGLPGPRRREKEEGEEGDEGGEGGERGRTGFQGPLPSPRPPTCPRLRLSPSPPAAPNGFIHRAQGTANIDGEPAGYLRVLTSPAPRGCGLEESPPSRTTD